MVRLTWLAHHFEEMGRDLKGEFWDDTAYGHNALALRLLLAERRGLREALEPFAVSDDDLYWEGSPDEAGVICKATLTVRDFRRARSALQGKGGEGG